MQLTNRAFSNELTVTENHVGTDARMQATGKMPDEAASADFEMSDIELDFPGAVQPMGETRTRYHVAIDVDDRTHEHIHAPMLGRVAGSAPGSKVTP